MNAADRALAFKANYTNPQSKVDSLLLDVGAKNFKLNREILPPIVETVITSSRQRIALQGHSQDKIDFSSPPTVNEGNFIAMIRLLANSNADLKEQF